MLKKILFGILCALFLCALGIILFAKDFEVQISEEIAQEAINAQIDAGPKKTLGVEIRLKNAEIDFRPDNTMKITADLETDALGYKHKIDGVFQSGINYRAPRLYLNDISPVSVNVEPDKDTEDELDEIKSAARKFLQRQKDRVKTENQKAALQILTEDTDLVQDAIVKASYGFFEFVPFYNLNNAGYKGSLASLALKDVHFTDDYAVVTLSPVQALLRILAIIGFLLLAIAYYIGPTIITFWLNKKLGRDEKPSDD